MKKLLGALSGTVLGVVLTGTSFATTITLAPVVDDAWQRVYSGTSASSGSEFSNYSDDSIFADEPVGVIRSGGQKELRYALEFYLGSIPTNAVVTSATFSIGNSSYGGSSGYDYRSEIAFSFYAADGAIAGDDFLETSQVFGGPLIWSSSAGVHPASNPLVFDVTSEVLGLPATDEYAGFLLFDTRAADGSFPTGSYSGSVFFYSTDSTGTSSRLPSLTIEYTLNGDQQRPGVPEPATLALMGLGLAGIAFARKKKQA